MRTFTILDTYEVALNNENPPRKEFISEIQANNGDLMCYANPDYAQEICNLLNRSQK